MNLYKLTTLGGRVYYAVANHPTKAKEIVIRKIPEYYLVNHRTIQLIECIADESEYGELPHLILEK